MIQSFHQDRIKCIKQSSFAKKTSMRCGTSFIDMRSQEQDVKLKHLMHFKQSPLGIEAGVLKIIEQHTVDGRNPAPPGICKTL